MKQLTDDLRAEGEELNALLATLSEDDWRRPTPFKDWTVEAVMQHLLVGDWMNALALTDPYKFSATLERRNAARAAGKKNSPGWISWTTIQARATHCALPGTKGKWRCVICSPCGSPRRACNGSDRT